MKTILNRKNRLSNYKIHGYKDEDKVKVDAFRIECQQAVETEKLSYLTYLGNKVNNLGTSQKSYWEDYQQGNEQMQSPKNNLVI